METSTCIKCGTHTQVYSDGMCKACVKAAWKQHAVTETTKTTILGRPFEEYVAERRTLLAD